MKLLTVIGARPQFIKASIVSTTLRECGAAIREIVVHTGQHYDPSMSAVFFSELGMKEPDYNLNVGSGLHGEQTGRMLSALEQVLLREQPDCVLVYGDTNSTLAGALTAAKLHIAVAHVEAGLRSFNREMPEEINRVLTDHVSELLFAPTETAVSHLRREGIRGEAVHLVGDVMFDVAIRMGARAENESRALAGLALRPKQYVLCTVHRAENTDSPECLRRILEALGGISRELPVIFPVHPRTRVALSRGQTLSAVPGVRMIEPLGYLDMALLEKNAALIATDSGGVQKEAFFYRVPCVTLRRETEWTELVEAGWNRLAPPEDAESICRSMRQALALRGTECSPYGDGFAARRIVGALSERFAPPARMQPV